MLKLRIWYKDLVVLPPSDLNPLSIPRWFFKWLFQANYHVQRSFPVIYLTVVLNLSQVSFEFIITFMNCRAFTLNYQERTYLIGKQFPNALEVASSTPSLTLWLNRYIFLKKCSSLYTACFSGMFLDR